MSLVEHYSERAIALRRGRLLEYLTYLSAILLGGLLLNALLGWWWADPVAAMIMVPIVAKEGIEALRGETSCGKGECH